MSSLSKAREHGYSDEQILEYFSQKNPANAEKVKKAIDSGYKPNEVSEFLAQSQEKKPFLKITEGQRLGAQHIARGAETILGAPRAAGEFLESLVPEKALKGLAKTVGLEKGAENLIETTKKYAPYKLLPKKEQVRDFGKMLFGNRLEPKNQWEQKSNELVEDFVDLTLGSKIAGQAKLLRPALTALGANLAKEGVSELGGSKDQQEYAKLGALGLSAFIQPNAAKDFYNKMYASARQARPKDAKVLTRALKPRLDNLEKELSKGGTESWKGKLHTKINEIRSGIQNNEIEVEQLEAFKPAVNRIISELYAEKNISKTGIKSAQRYANKLAKVIDKSLSQYGRQNPEWESFYRPANEAFGAEQKSMKAMNFIKKNIAKLGLSHAGSTALLTYLGGMPALGGAAAATALGYPTLKAGEKIVQLLKSPALRKAFIDMYKGALTENLLSTSKSAKKLEKAITEDHTSSTSLQTQ